MNILFLSGSFHSKSRSLAILKAIEPYFKGHDIQTPRLDALPFYSEDLNHHKPPIVHDFIAQVQACDGIICCTPEYNHSIPAVLKNAIDWASRPAFASPLKDKSVSIITQAHSPVGGARAQAHLKLIFDSTLSINFPAHEMMIAGIDHLLDKELVLSDAKTLARLERYCAEFLKFAERNKGYLHA